MTTILNQRYEIHERMGEGGMATVYRATQLKLSREVAVKFIKTDELGKAFIKRFEREAVAVAKLNHPNITQVYDFDYDENDAPYMVMELLRGHDLAAFMRINKPLSTGDVLTIMQGTALALGYAHANGIIHRDVKPSNIFITNDRRVKLMDFGLVKQVTPDGASVTATGLVMGTPHYISPEQAGGEPLDHRSDIYALGVTYYEMLTGETLFKGDSALKIAVQHITTPAPDPSTLRPGLPPIASVIAGRMLTKKPEERYQNATELLEDLAKFAETLNESSGLLPRFAPGSLTIDMPEVEVGLNTIVLNEDEPVSDSQSMSTSARLSTISTAVLKQSISLPLPILLLLIVVGIGVAAFVISNISDEPGTSSAENTVPELDIAPPADDEYLVLVAQWSETADTLERRIADTLISSDVVALSPNLMVRVEPIEVRVTTFEQAQALSESVGAHLMVWGVEDEVGVEVIFQDIYAEPESIDTIRFIIPRNDEYNEVVAEDLPVALRMFFSTMMLHHFVRTEDVDGLLSFAVNTGVSNAQDLRIIPSRDVDRHVLRQFEWEEDADNITNTIDAVSDAIRLAPGDPTLYVLRSFYEGFNNGDITRARVDADTLRELLGVNNLTIFMDMNNSIAEQDYEEILALSQNLDPDALGYGIPFSYRQIALIMTGEFEQVQEETFGEVTGEDVLGLPMWNILSAMMLQIQGNETAFEELSVELATNRELEESATYIAGFAVPPVDFYLIGGYVSELTANAFIAQVTYGLALDIDPDHFIMNWRLGHLQASSGNVAAAYDGLTMARDSAPVPFPIATIELSQLIHDNGDDVPENAPDACALLDEALSEVESNPDFYATLLEQTEAQYADYGCDV